MDEIKIKIFVLIFFYYTRNKTCKHVESTIYSRINKMTLKRK